MSVLILDNRDSFVFNLQHRLFEVGVAADVVRSDAVSVEQIARRNPTGLVISPGPGHPDDAGVSIDAIRQLGSTLPILGVCLGHQAIGVAFGGVVSRDEKPCHGRATAVTHTGHPLFEGVEPTFPAARYHALAIEEPLPGDLLPIARGDGLVMAVVHRSLPIFGVQFHPESILSPDGTRILGNWARLAGLTAPR